MTERPARFLPGLRMLVLGIVVLLAGVALHDHGGGAKAVILLCVLIFLAGFLMLRGLTAVVPGQARVLQRFGSALEGPKRHAGQAAPGDPGGPPWADQGISYGVRCHWSRS